MKWDLASMDSIGTATLAWKKNTNLKNGGLVESGVLRQPPSLRMERRNRVRVYGRKPTKRDPSHGILLQESDAIRGDGMWLNIKEAERLLVSLERELIRITHSPLPPNRREK